MQATHIAEGVALAKERIAAAHARAGRTDDQPTIVAAIKYVEVKEILGLVRAGVTTFGENRLPALELKRAAYIGLQESIQNEGLALRPVRWHFIGRLQSRYAPQVAQNAHCIHSLYKNSAAARLARAREEQGIAIPELLVQVNIDGDATKDGIEAANLEAFIDGLPEGITVNGLMAMPAFAENPEDSRGAFAGLHDLAEKMRRSFGELHPLNELSMGTSQDFEVAVEEGATLVRLGRVLYDPYANG